MGFETLLRRLSAPRGPRPSAALREATYPPPYPRGWFRLCASDELRPGKLRYVECLGEALVVFRSASGAPAALDAFCPHLGASLALGRVLDGCVECSFHRWRIDDGGVVREVPGVADGLTRRTRAWPVRERHGLVLVWFEPNRSHLPEPLEPAWELDPFPELDDGRFVRRGRYDGGTVDMHIQEFAENAVDFAHFTPLHGEMRVPFLGFRIPGLTVRHSATWETGGERPHEIRFRNDAVLRFRGRDRPSTRARADVTFHGPAGIVSFRFAIPGAGEIHLFQTHLPVAPLRQRVHFLWFAERRMPRALAHYVVGTWISQWRSDVAIWESKIYRGRPLLTAADGPVQELRRWYAQFYEPSAAARVRELPQTRRTG